MGGLAGAGGDADGLVFKGEGMMFRVGQKVVCVDAKGEHSPKLVQGRIYTIASIRFFDASEANFTGLGITLVEQPTFETKAHWAEYRAERFRPVAERKTDISFAHEILRRVSHKQGERA